MSYSAANRLLMPMRHSIDTVTDSWLAMNDSALSGTWPSANLAIYVPLAFAWRVVVKKLWFASGSTATGNVDMALYDAGWTAVVSATGAAKTGTGEQVFDVTDTIVGPGLYYVALASDSATDTFYRLALAAPIPASYGVYSEESAYPLPSTATPVLSQTLAAIPIMGALIEATVA